MYFPFFTKLTKQAHQRIHFFFLNIVVRFCKLLRSSVKRLEYITSFDNNFTYNTNQPHWKISGLSRNISGYRLFHEANTQNIFKNVRWFGADFCLKKNILIFSSFFFYIFYRWSKFYFIFHNFLFYFPDFWLMIEWM